MFSVARGCHVKSWAGQYKGTARCRGQRLLPELLQMPGNVLHAMSSAHLPMAVPCPGLQHSLASVHCTTGAARVNKQGSAPS